MKTKPISVNGITIPLTIIFDKNDTRFNEHN